MTPDINIEVVDASFIRAGCGPGIAQELSDHFTFDIPGAVFMGNFKRGGRGSKGRGGWDGKIRLFNKRNLQLPTGLYDSLREFAAGRRYSSSISINGPEGFGPRNWSEIETRNFVSKLSICGNDGTGITLREDQLDGITRSIRYRRNLILSPTASGKSVISYVIAVWQRAMVPNSKILVLVPRVQLCRQLFSDWSAYSSSNKWNVEKNVHVIHEGKAKFSSKPIFISTWQSLYELPSDYFEQFTCIIGDEAHEFKAKSLTHIMNSSINAWDRVGLTGTLDGTKTHKMMLEGLFGTVQRVSTSRELMDKGAIAKLNPIKCLVLKHPVDVCKSLKALDGGYEDEIQCLIKSEARNRFITNLALSLKGNTLVLYQRVEDHGVVLHKILKNQKNNTYLVHGGIDQDVREQIRAIVETENNAIIVASYGTFSTGINIRNLHNVIFASPYKSRIKILQSLGRGLRLGEYKDAATLFDISDDLRVNDKAGNNFTLNHMEERLRIYVEEQFLYKMYPINLGTSLYEQSDPTAD